LEMYAVIPSFFPCFESTKEIIFLNAVEYCLWLASDIRHCFKTSSLKFHFQFGKWSEITWGWIQWVGRLGSDNHVVVSHKLWFSGTCGWAHCHDERAICGCAIVLVFFIAHFLSGVSKCHSMSKSQSWP
jgi:hypothetical protein